MKRNFVKLLSIILSLSLTLTVFTLPVNASDEYTSLLNLLDTQRIGNLSEEQLLDYYKTKFNDIDYLYCADDNAASENVCNGMFCFSENIISQKQVSTQQEKIIFPLSFDDLRTSYLLSTYKHSEDSGICMLSSENGDMYAPTLTVYCDDGTYTFTALIDTYVRATGISDNNQNATTVYGETDANNLWAMHCADMANRMPYSSNEMRTYLLFDISELNGKTVQSAELSIYAQIKNPNSDSVPSDTILPLVLMTPNYRVRDEENFCWSTLKSSRAIGHYSWDGLGGFIFDEELYGINYKNLGVPNGFLKSISDFSIISALCRDGYYENAKNYLMSFVSQTADIVGNNGFLDSSSYEPARCLIEFPYIYKTLLVNNMLTAQENSVVLKWLYSNIDYIYREQPTENFNSVQSIANICGLYNSFAFWGEFTAASDWETTFLSRIETVRNKLINSDGSFINASFVYPSSVINGFSQMLVYMICGEYNYANTFKNDIYYLANYIIHCAYPDGNLPEYGDNLSTDAASLINLPIYALCNDTVSQNVLWYITGGEQGIEPKKSALYKDAKIATDRTGWSNDDSMIFMNAKSGGDFTHADALSLLMYAYGRNLLTDTGNVAVSSELTEIKSNTAAHNTVEVDSVPQNISDKDSAKDNINMYADNGASVIRAYTTANENVTHYRNVAFIKALGGLTVVNDLLVPDDTQPHTYSQNWHSLQGANIKTTSDIGTYSDNKWGYTDFSSGANLMISQANDCIADTPYGLDAHSPGGYAPYMSFSKNGVGPASYNTAIYPYEGSNGGVHTIKLSTGVSDSIASAMKIQTFSSAQLTELENETIYYNSFENNTTQRNVNVTDNRYFVTDAKNVFYNTDSSENLNMLFVSNGCTLDIFNVENKIASVSADKSVSDFSVVYDKESMTVNIETSDTGVLNKTTDVDIILPENDNAKIKNVFVNGTQLGEYGNITVNGRTFKQCTITFDANGGVCTAQPMDINYGEPYGTLPTPEKRVGYNFDGWYTDAYSGEKITEKSIVTENIVLYAHWIHDTFTFNENSNLLYDAEQKIVYGILPSVTEEDLKSAFLNTNLSVYGVNGRIGTGVQLLLTDDKGDVYDTVTTIVFGDVNGDGLYDGNDAVIVNCIIGGLLTKQQVGEVQYSAADCNHDGIIDEYDSGLLQQAGLLLVNIDQAKSDEELSTNSTYVEYLNLINQTVTNEKNTNNPLDIVIRFFKELITLIKAFIANII